MLEELRKYLDQASRIDGQMIEKIMVTRDNLEGFAKFWEFNQDTLVLFSAVALHKYTSEVDFTKEELIAFKKGLATDGLFFKQCYDLSKKLEAQEQQRSIVKK
jgi:hypothetical protein